MEAAAAAAAKSLQLCLTLCDPRDSSPPGSPVPGILQARTLEWGAIAFSMARLINGVSVSFVNWKQGPLRLWWQEDVTTARKSLVNIEPLGPGGGGDEHGARDNITWVLESVKQGLQLCDLRQVA